MNSENKLVYTISKGDLAITTQILLDPCNSMNKNREKEL